MTDQSWQRFDVNSALFLIITSGILFLSTGKSIAQEFFYVRGGINVEAGVEPEIEKFYVQKIDTPSAIPIEFGEDYRKVLPLAEYANNLLLFSFTFPEGSCHIPAGSMAVF